jgi:hypothetical protein
VGEVGVIVVTSGSEVDVAVMETGSLKCACVSSGDTVLLRVVDGNPIVGDDVIVPGVHPTNIDMANRIMEIIERRNLIVILISRDKSIVYLGLISR